VAVNETPRRKSDVIEERHSTYGRFLPLLIAGFMAGSAILLADGASGSGAISISNSAPILQNFDTLSNSTSPSNVLPTGWYLTEIGTGAAADGSYVVGTGSSNAGGAYSFGAAASTDRALGSVGSGSVTPIFFERNLPTTALGRLLRWRLSSTARCGAAAIPRLQVTV
jgi:hypothetical protein